MTAWFLGRRFGANADISIYEASPRLGGKVITQRFGKALVPYEAGVAEIYGYSAVGPDPLRDLIECELGLSTTPMDGDAVVLDRRMHIGVSGIERHYGPATARAIRRFRALCASMLTPQEYYDGDIDSDNKHRWARITEAELLTREIDDRTARKYFEVMARSDIAADPHQTNGLNALKNFLMDVDGYIDTYSIDGGMERLVSTLAGRVPGQIHLNHRVGRVGIAPSGRYRVTMTHDSRILEREFDLIFLCLPHNWLSTVSFDDEKLAQAMTAHIAHFDRPAHYLRLAMLFDRPFWGDAIPGSWFMSEAFGGCCVYDEGKRHDTLGYGVLNWLIPGSAVLAWGNLELQPILDAAFDTLPPPLREQARAHLIEARVHRFLASVNAVPGGMIARSVDVNHMPGGAEYPGLYAVGDYLFDSTLNGLLDSADYATDFALDYATALNEAASRTESIAAPLAMAAARRA